MQTETSVKGDIFQMQMEKVRVKEDDVFDLQLNREYKIYQGDNFEKLLDEKVRKELSLKKLKAKLNFVIYPCALFVLYSLFLSSASILTLIAFILFVGSYFTYIVNKVKIKDIINIKDSGEIKRISDESFLDSFASPALINAYKQVYGEEKYAELLFQNGSDAESIQIKKMIN